MRHERVALGNRTTVAAVYFVPPSAPSQDDKDVCRVSPGGTNAYNKIGLFFGDLLVATIQFLPYSRLIYSSSASDTKIFFKSLIVALQ